VTALILSKVVLVVILLLATAQVSAPIDSDLKSVSEPIAGVVLMLMAGFAPYLTYKAISFMGFDMYHAMSAEQEAKSALNRPLPIPMSRRPGSEPSKVLDGGSSGSGRAASAPVAAPSGAGGGGAPGASGQGASTGGGSAAAGAGGAVAAGVIVAKEAATAGGRTGSSVGAAASQQTDAADQAPAAAGTAMPPHVADSVPTSTINGNG
jgi:type IV secretion system protein TrbL